LLYENLKARILPRRIPLRRGALQKKNEQISLTPSKQALASGAKFNLNLEDYAK